MRSDATITVEAMVVQTQRVLDETKTRVTEVLQLAVQLPTPPVAVDEPMNVTPLRVKPSEPAVLVFAQVQITDPKLIGASASRIGCWCQSIW